MSIHSIKAAALALAIGVIAQPHISLADVIDDFVVQKVYDAAMSGNNEVALSMVTDDVFFTVLPAPGHPIWQGAPYLSGKDAVGAWWEFLASDNSRLEIVELKVEGNRAMFLFEFYGDFLKGLDVEPAMSDVMAILREGKIHGMMLSFTPGTLEAIAAARN
ncbi:MAG: nuclear transport factor 2 family protein [Boseongicola sp.]|nr:nuclear transport factor 2 family protein [Boseongicola sp.]